MYHPSQAGMSESADLELLVYTSLWGNLADLSFSAGDADEGSRHYGLSSAKTASQLASAGGKVSAVYMPRSRALRPCGPAPCARMPHESRTHARTPGLAPARPFRCPCPHCLV